MSASTMDGADMEAFQIAQQEAQSAHPRRDTVLSAGPKADRAQRNVQHRAVRQDLPPVGKWPAPAPGARAGFANRLGRMMMR
jgi:hypothetical protein